MFYLITEDNAYENTLPVGNGERENSDPKSPSKNRKIELKYSREPSQCNITDPCGSEPGQTSDPQKEVDIREFRIHVDEDGYLLPQSTPPPPSYLDIANFPAHGPVDSEEEHNFLGNQQQQSLDMKSSIGLAKDNQDNYEDEAKYLATSGSADSTKLGMHGANEKSDQDRPEYLLSQSTTPPPSYLDIVYFPEHGPVDLQEKHNILGNQQQLSLDMKFSTELAKDNQDNYEDEAKYLATSGSARSSKYGMFGANEKSDQNRPEYYNKSFSSVKPASTYPPPPETQQDAL